MGWGQKSIKKKGIIYPGALWMIVTEMYDMVLGSRIWGLVNYPFMKKVMWEHCKLMSSTVVGLE